MNIVGIIVAVLLFAVLIVGHEFGHFATAKYLGVKVLEFSLGMGPCLWKKQKGETQYSVRAVPIGGYCKLEGEDGDEEGAEPDPRSFSQQPAWAKILILVAGSFMNIVIGVVMVACVLICMGSATTTLDSVTPGGQAEKAGIMAGDTVLTVEGTAYDRWSDIVEAISKGTDDGTVSVEVERDGQRLSFDVPLDFVEEEDRYIIGIVTRVEHSVGTGFRDALIASGSMFVALKDFFVQLFAGTVSSQDVVGVVGVVSIVSQEAQTGLSSVFYMMGLISVNLAAMNLLPIPALDGGRVLFVLLRKVSRGKIGENAEAIVNTVGFVLLMILMVFLVVKDVFQFVL